MSRPSQNLDQKLIELGKEKIVISGVSNLSVRQICLAAGINLGMFYYYFKTKENYIKELFKSLNHDLTAGWLIEAAKLSTSEQKLKKMLMLHAKMMREQRGMIETIIKDINIFDKMYVEIGKELHDARMKIYSDLINECKNDGYLDKNIETEEFIAIFTGSVHTYARICEAYEYDNERYYLSIEKMVDFLMQKFRVH
ncbi:MAG: TetR/AcrR family transcriptional regulator [Endomicrobia bacterium]|nr:TetR/AcrR family transcriptional regulator [Endomicrobiia bacterium]